MTELKIASGSTKMLRCTLATALFLIAFALPGRSRYDASVSGTVRVDGQPLPCGTVMFFSAVPGPPAYGMILAGGEYRLQTGSERGLPTGDYQVAVVAHEAPKQMFGPNGEPTPPGKRLTPVKYQRKETSGLQFTIKPGSNQIDLELSSKE